MCVMYIYYVFLFRSKSGNCLIYAYYDEWMKVIVLSAIFGIIKNWNVYECTRDRGKWALSVDTLNTATTNNSNNKTGASKWKKIETMECVVQIWNLKNRVIVLWAITAIECVKFDFSIQLLRFRSFTRSHHTQKKKREV